MNDFLSIPNSVDKIQIRKMIASMISEAKSNAKPSKCILCGENQTSFCNSHSVPKMALKAIAENGKVLQASSVIGFDFLDIDDGVNRSGTFFYICNKCDSTFFQDYEDPDEILVSQTDRMLAEIAVKNILLQISKRAIEKELVLIQQRELHAFVNPEDDLEIQMLDINEYLSELQLHKRIKETNEIGGYQILFRDVLPYKVPIAMQSAIAMRTDMNGGQINDVFDDRETTRMQYLHLLVLPFDSKSLVLAFYHKRDKLYRNLRHQFNSSSKSTVLKFLNYIIFAYTENFYLSKSIYKAIESNEALRKLSQENNGAPNLGFLSERNNFGIGYVPVSPNDIPNFLSEEWAI